MKRGLGIFLLIFLLFINFIFAIPLYSSNSTNNTIAGGSTLFSLFWNDSVKLNGYIFSTNNSGEWANDSWVSFGSNFEDMGNWSYRKSHVILNSSNAGINYPVSFTIINDSGTDSGDIIYTNLTHSDFIDLRFTNSSGGLLDYWVEETNTGINATFWVEIDGNLSLTNQTIYVYYGNVNAASISNGTATFDFFDDFDDGSIDTTKWNAVNGATVSVSESGGSSRIAASSSGVWNVGYLNTKFNFSQGHALRTRQYHEQASGNILTYCGFLDPVVSFYIGGGQTDTIYHYLYRYNWVSGGLPFQGIGWMKDGAGKWAVTTNPRDAWKIFEYQWGNGFSKLLYNGISESSTTNTTVIPQMSLKAGCNTDAGSGANGNIYSDWFLVRKYSNPEPAHSTWGDEEISSSKTGWSNVTKVLNSTIGISVSWCVYANDTSNNWNLTSCLSPFKLITTSNDTTYSIFSNHSNNNASIVSGGLALFNATIKNTNGTVYLTINKANYFATNLTANVYNVSLLGLTNGTYLYNWKSYGNGTYENLNTSNNKYYTITRDTDNDGSPDSLDPLLYNETNVTTSGVTNLNITVAGNLTNGSFTESQEVLFHDGSTLMVNFTHNFTESNLDLSNITIIKDANYIIINLSNQLQTNYNKTIYIADNNFISLCARDDEVNSIDEISSNCGGNNETDFTNCIDNNTGVTKNNITCTDEGSTIKIENLRYSVVKGTQFSGSGGFGGSGGSGGSGGGSSPKQKKEIKCIPDWVCSPWSFCSKDYTQMRICEDINNCEEIPTTETRQCPDILFDALVNIDTKNIYSWSELNFDVNLKEVNSLDLVDIKIIYRVSQNNRIIYEESETKAIQTELNYNKKIHSLHLLPGEYHLSIIIEYGKNQTASTEQIFSVMGITSIIIYSFILILLLIIIFIARLLHKTIQHERKLEEQLKYFENKFKNINHKAQKSKKWMKNKIEKVKSQTKNKHKKNVKKLMKKLVKKFKKKINESKKLIYLLDKFLKKDTNELIKNKK